MEGVSNGRGPACKHRDGSELGIRVPRGRIRLATCDIFDHRLISLHIIPKIYGAGTINLLMLDILPGCLFLALKCERTQLGLKLASLHHKKHKFSSTALRVIGRTSSTFLTLHRFHILREYRLLHTFYISGLFNRS